MDSLLMDQTVSWKLSTFITSWKIIYAGASASKALNKRCIFRCVQQQHWWHLGWVSHWNNSFRLGILHLGNHLHLASHLDRIWTLNNLSPGHQWLPLLQVKPVTWLLNIFGRIQWPCILLVISLQSTGYASSYVRHLHRQLRFQHFVVDLVGSPGNAGCAGSHLLAFCHPHRQPDHLLPSTEPIRRRASWI